MLRVDYYLCKLIESINSATISLEKEEFEEDIEDLFDSK